jgi:hypothetical protein
MAFGLIKALIHLKESAFKSAFHFIEPAIQILNEFLIHATSPRAKE